MMEENLMDVAWIFGGITIGLMVIGFLRIFSYLVSKEGQL